MNNGTETRIIDFEKSRDLKFDLKHADKLLEPNSLQEVYLFYSEIVHYVERGKFYFW